ncbi:MAG: hypothetical protein Q8L59_11150 [Phenylobacterium sp.]|uniref:hypothetical protein n=1 Tax=Phenylobacterium sp. TaxID=1871053 RepID=UPI002732712E|nr:hypothetical protein [Phenylobacterium sp.]MDP1642731.1 hypothetical protein [Phenylobacterium sp.]MDP3117221.1 hypothetical protein [Phenylobacterium sp.]
MSAAALAATEEVVSKGQFAILIGVSPGRVSQMISEGKIDGDALSGEGRSAKIRVEVARAQLRERTDLGQRLGNGLETRLDGSLPFSGHAPLTEGAPDNAPRLAGAGEPSRFPSPTHAPPPGPTDPVADRLKQLKLSDAERRERQALEGDLARRGAYVRSDQSRAAMVGVAQSMLNVFEGSLADLAQALATRFELPHRDVAHVLRQEFRAVRARAATAARERAEELPRLILDDAPTEPGGEARSEED